MSQRQSDFTTTRTDQPMMYEKHDRVVLVGDDPWAGRDGYVQWIYEDGALSVAIPHSGSRYAYRIFVIKPEDVERRVAPALGS